MTKDAKPISEATKFSDGSWAIKALEGLVPRSQEAQQDDSRATRGTPIGDAARPLYFPVDGDDMIAVAELLLKVGTMNKSPLVVSVVKAEVAGKTGESQDQECLSTNLLAIGIQGVGPNDVAFVLPPSLTSDSVAKLVRDIAQRVVFGFDLKTLLKLWVAKFGDIALPAAAYDLSTVARMIHFARSRNDFPDQGIPLEELDRMLTQKTGDRSSSASPQHILPLQQAAVDCATTVRMVSAITQGVAAGSIPISEAARDLEAGFLPEVVRIENRGMPINVAALDEVLKRARASMASADLVFKKRGVNPFKHLPRQKQSAAPQLLADGFGVLTPREHSEDTLDTKVHNYLSNKSLADFVQGILCRAKDGRVYPNINEFQARTGRMSARNPNVMGIPRRLQPFFYGPRPGRVVIHGDYPAMDMRSTAVIAPDQFLIDLFKRGENPHTLMAEKLMAKMQDPEMTLESVRPRAKVANLGFLFGMSAKGFLDYALKKGIVNLSLQDAELFRSEFMQAYPGIRQWHEATDKQFEDYKNVTVFTLLKRPMIADSLFKALNYQVQGTGTEIIKNAAVLFGQRCRECGVDAGIVNIIHDCIDVECAADVVDVATEHLQWAMGEAADSALKEFQTVVDVKIVADGSKPAEVPPLNLFRLDDAGLWG